MKPHQIYQKIRGQRSKKISLRWQLTLFVSSELVACVLLALGLYYLLKDVIPIKPSMLLFIVLIVVSLAIGALITSFVAKYFFDPIRKLSNKMDQVASGDFTVRLDDRSPSNEIMEVYSGFNMMVSQLQATEILQSDFVSNVSHEFKTPINAIQGYSTLLQSCDSLSQDQQKYLDKILFNTQRLSHLVDSVLLLSKIENQTIPAKSNQYRLDEQIRQSIVALEPLWAKQETIFDIDLECIDYTGNEMLMHHVWNNLISNAIKFSPKSSTVAIRLIKDGKKAIFTIDNIGEPLSEDVIRHLFDKFYQADSSHKAEGNGLGLALVKRILDFSEDEITAENIPGGCRFTVTLKL